MIPIFMSPPSGACWPDAQIPCSDSELSFDQGLNPRPATRRVTKRSRTARLGASALSRQMDLPSHLLPLGSTMEATVSSPQVFEDGVYPARRTSSFAAKSASSSLAAPVYKFQSA